MSKVSAFDSVALIVRLRERSEEAHALAERATRKAEEMTREARAAHDFMVQALGQDEEVGSNTVFIVNDGDETFVLSRSSQHTVDWRVRRVDAIASRS